MLTPYLNYWWGVEIVMVPLQLALIVYIWDAGVVAKPISSLAKCVSYAHNTGPPDTDNKTVTNRDNNDFGLCYSS